MACELGLFHGCMTISRTFDIFISHMFRINLFPRYLVVAMEGYELIGLRSSVVSVVWALRSGRLLFYFQKQLVRLCIFIHHNTFLLESNNEQCRFWRTMLMEISSEDQHPGWSQYFEFPVIVGDVLTLNYVELVITSLRTIFPILDASLYEQGSKDGV